MQVHAPIRFQDEYGECVRLDSLWVASSTSKKTLTKAQQHTLVRLADWVVSDVVQYTRARRQRKRRRMIELITAVQRVMNYTVSKEPVFRIPRAAYPDAVISGTNRAQRWKLPRPIQEHFVCSIPPGQDIVAEDHSRSPARKAFSTRRLHHMRLSSSTYGSNQA
jgi:hypothetical protein